MSGKSEEEKREEHASLLRQGAGNYSNLCGVLTGFVAVLMVLVLTPGFSAETLTNPLSQLFVIFFAISTMGFVLTALGFINISSTPLWRYKSLADMRREYAFNQALVVLFTLIFVAGVAALTFSTGALYMGIVGLTGFVLLPYYLVKDWWALAKRSPPTKSQREPEGGKAK